MGRPHVGMLRGGRGHGDPVTAAGALAPVVRTRGTVDRGGGGGEGGVTGSVCEGQMDARRGGTWRDWVLEWEVTVAHVGQVVMLVVRQERRGVVVVVLLIMEGRPWKTRD